MCESTFVDLVFCTDSVKYAEHDFNIWLLRLACLQSRIIEYTLVNLNSDIEISVDFFPAVVSIFVFLIFISDLEKLLPWTTDILKSLL